MADHVTKTGETQDERLEREPATVAATVANAHEEQIEMHFNTMNLPEVAIHSPYASTIDKSHSRLERTQSYPTYPNCYCYFCFLSQF